MRNSPFAKGSGKPRQLLQIRLLFPFFPFFANLGAPNEGALSDESEEIRDHEVILINLKKKKLLAIAVVS